MNIFKKLFKKQPKSILRLIEGKPSKAIEGMIRGLENQSKRKDFVVSMSTFGDAATYDGVCFGCAATCTIQELAQQNLIICNISDEKIRAQALGFEQQELSDFELAIDALRCTDAEPLFIFCGKVEPWGDEIFRHLHVKLEDLSTNMWQERLQPYRDLAAYLSSIGL